MSAFKAVVFSFLFLVKKSQRIYIKRRVDYSTERRLAVCDRMTILNKKINIIFFVLCLLEKIMIYY